MLESNANQWVDINLERQIVSTALKGSLPFDPTLVKTDYFTNQALRTIWAHIYQVWLSGKPVDLVTVSAALDNGGVIDAVGGYSGVTQLCTWLVPDATDKHCRALENLWQRRVTHFALEKAITDLDSGKVPIKEIIATFDSKALATVGESDNSYSNKSDELDEVVHQILNPMDTDCVATPWPSLDQMIGGLRPEELVVLAGRPGMGKTAMMVTLQRDLAKRNIPTLTFSLDMGRKQLWNRYISQESSVPVSHLERGLSFTAEEERIIVDSVTRIKEMPLWVDTNPYRTLAEIRMLVRQHIAKYGTQVVMIDHIGKIRPDKANSRQEEVSIIAQGLKAMTKEFSICICPLVQLNRNVELRADKRPMISDIRESGTIEQEADIILMAYRPEYYDLPHFTDGISPSKGKMELIAAKNRNGKVGSVFLDFKGELTYVGEPDKTHLFEIDPAPWEDEHPTHQIATFN